MDTAGTFCDGPGDLRSRWPLDDLRGCKAPVIPFYDTLKASKPDYLVPSVKYVPDIIFYEIEPRLRRGERPGQGLIESI